jgi:hypothetical protein
MSSPALSSSLIGAPVERPHLEHEPHALRAGDQVLRQDAEVGRAALEPGTRTRMASGCCTAPNKWRV